MTVAVTLVIVFSAVSAVPLQQAAADGDSIGICCAWNENKLGDGDLTYKINGGDEAARQAVRDAIEEWDAAVSGLTLTEVSGKIKPDIDVKFKKGGGVIAGQALRHSDGNGFIDSVRLMISGSAFGAPNNVDTVEQITKHEMGHSLGLGHANFDGDLMSTTVQSGTGTISSCDVQGVSEANHWKLVDGSDEAHHPHVTHVHC
jgi:matrixin